MNAIENYLESSALKRNSTHVDELIIYFYNIKIGNGFKGNTTKLFKELAETYKNKSSQYMNIVDRVVYASLSDSGLIEQLEMGEHIISYSLINGMSEDYIDLIRELTDSMRIAAEEYKRFSA